jgi:hypothetical protein
MKNSTQPKFVEDLLQEQELDVDAILTAKFKHPFKAWINYKFFIAGVFLREQQFKIKLFIRKFFKTNK